MNTNIEILRKALCLMDVSFTEIPNVPDIILVSHNVFVRSATPFNDQGVSVLCRDKDAVYKILKETVSIPKTKSILDPKGKYPELSAIKNIDDISQLSLDFIYPCIVKMNQGERGTHVFIVRSLEEVRSALTAIFDKTNRDYDYLALIQEYIEPTREIRAMVSGGEVVFCYDRFSKEIIKGDIVREIAKRANDALEKIPLVWGAIDFIESKDGQLYFVEMNTKPEFSLEFVNMHETFVIDLYKKAFERQTHSL